MALNKQQLEIMSSDEFLAYLYEHKKHPVLRGAHIKAIRKKFNLSQRCFSEMLGISLRTYQNYEINRRTPPTPAAALIRFAGDNVEFFKKHYSKYITNQTPYCHSNYW